MKTTYDGHGRSNYHYQKIYLQVRVRSGSANKFSMSSIIVCDSNGKNWIIEGDPFHAWAKYKTPWFELAHWQPTGAQNDTDTLANCNKVEHAKI